MSESDSNTKQSLDSKESNPIKIVVRRVEKHYIWYCEKCRLSWVYDRNITTDENWRKFLVHPNSRGIQCQPFNVNKSLIQRTDRTDMRLLPLY